MVELAPPITVYQTVVMQIELAGQHTEKGTLLLDGESALQQVCEYVRNRYDLSNSTVAIYLVEPEDPTPRSEASYVSLQKKKRTLESAGIQVDIQVLPSEISYDTFFYSISSSNRNPKVSGIIIQMPVPKHVRNIAANIDFVKDIDALNLHNDQWVLSATADAAMRILYTKQKDLKKIALVGARGFIGRQLQRSIIEQDIAELLSLDFEDSLDHVNKCETIVSAVGQPDLIQAKHLHRAACLGIDIGNTKSNNKIRGDFDIDGIDGRIQALTPVPGGMGPLEMLILIERVVKNTIDPDFTVTFFI